MVLNILGGRVEVYKPDNQDDSATATPDHVVESPDLRAVSVKGRIQESADVAKVLLNNPDGEYTGAITSGDKLVFSVDISTGGEGSPESQWGESSYGQASYGGGEANSTVRRWVGLATSPRPKRTGPTTRRIEIDAQDFVFGVMNLGRHVDNAFRDRPVSEIARTIINDEAPELDTSGIEDFGVNYSTEFVGTPLIDAVTELANEVDAVLTSEGETVVMKRAEAVPTLWEATEDDFALPWEVDIVDDQLYNYVRIEGGTGNYVGDKQETQSGYTTVAESSRLQHQLDLSKSRIDAVELWTRTTGSGENVFVRIQEDKGGSPPAPGNSQNDLVNLKIDSQFLDDDGFTTFNLKRTNLPATDAWLLVESGGTNGQDIGVNGSGTPAFRAYCHYPIIGQNSDQSSIDEYRRREHRISDDSIVSTDAALSLAQSKVRHHNLPRHEFSADAATRRAHNLRPGNAVRLPFEKDAASGTFLVAERQDKYAENSSTRNLLKTSLRLQQVETL